VFLLDVKANKRPSGSLQGSRFLFLFLFLLLTFTQPSESAALRALIAKGGLLGRRKRPAPVVEAEEDSGPLAEERESCNDRNALCLLAWMTMMMMTMMMTLMTLMMKTTKMTKMTAMIGGYGRQR
jgi:hypothetical protein